MNTPETAILDTNVALDCFAFDGPMARPLKAAVLQGNIRLLTCEACLEKLARVLRYPKLKLEAAERAATLERFRAAVEVVPLVRVADVPRCRDRDDQVFLELAAACSHLHQAHGALAIVGLDGITEFSDALEKLFSALSAAEVPEIEPAIAAAPPEWVDAIPGERLVAAHVAMIELVDFALGADAPAAPVKKKQDRRARVNQKKKQEKSEQPTADATETATA